MIRRLLSAYRVLFPKKTPKVSWQPTGFSYRYEGHDESKARDVFTREQEQAKRRRQRSAKAIAEAQRPAKDNVTPLRRKA